MRYQIRRAGKDCYSIVDTVTGRVEVSEESIGVCDSIISQLNGGAWGESESQEVADGILARA